MPKTSPPKSVLITGCSEGGIGDAVAKEFHANGLRVFATARNLKSIQHLKEMGMTILPLDVVDPNSIEEAVKSVEAFTGGTLDFLVNNSGIGEHIFSITVMRGYASRTTIKLIETTGYSMPILDSDLSKARQMFEVNVFGVVAVVQAFSRLLISSKGTIINIGSVNGCAPLPWIGLYNASKAASNHLTDILRQEMAPFGVKVILILSGVVKTNFFTNEKGQTLPENSLYLPAKATIEGVLSGTSLVKYQADRGEYAKAVVTNALKSSPKSRLLAGGFATVLWAAGSFFTTSLWVCILPFF